MTTPLSNRYINKGIKVVCKEITDTANNLIKKKKSKISSRGKTQCYPISAGKVDVLLDNEKM